MKKDWEIKTVEEVCDTLTDGNWIESKDQSSSGIRLIQTGNVGEGVFKDRESKSRYISEETFKRLNCTEIFEGDCLISRLPEPVGRACLIPKLVDRSITAVDCSILRFNKDLDARFFVYFSLSSNYLFEVEQQCSGATRKRISRKNLGKLSIPVPPMLEQKRIVKILDDKFGQIDELKKITEQQIVNAKELFESRSGEMFMISESTCSINEVSNLYDSLHKTPEYVPDGFPMVRVTDIKPGSLNLDKTRKVTKETFEEFSKKHMPKVGDIVFSRVGSYGVSAIVDTDEKFCLGQNTVILEPKINSKFLYYFINSKIAKDQIDKLVAGATQPTISLKSIKAIVLPVYDEEKQGRIVKDLDELSEKTNKLVMIFQNKIDGLEELKKSYLQDAFAGKL